MVLDDGVELSKAANACNNPLSCCAQLDYTKKLGAKTVIVTAAAS